MTNLVPLARSYIRHFEPPFDHFPDLMISDIHIERHFIVPVEHYVISYRPNSSSSSKKLTYDYMSEKLSNLAENILKLSKKIMRDYNIEEAKKSLIILYLYCL